MAGVLGTAHKRTNLECVDGADDATGHRSNAASLNNFRAFCLAVLHLQHAYVY
jgi:hypothetical protein